GIPERKIVDYLQAFVGYNPSQATADRKPPQPDIVSGATVTVLVMGESVVRSALRVTRALQAGTKPGGTAQAVRVLDPAAGAIADWKSLVDEGAVRHLRLTIGEVNEA